MDVDLIDQGRLCVDVLEFFGGDVLSLGQLKDVLCAINDSNTAIGKHDADVTRHKPAIDERLFVLLLVHEVASEDRGTGKAYLTARVRLVPRSVPHLWDVSQTNL